MSLIMLDIDAFKEFNDAFGHQVADDCLRVVERAIEAGVDNALIWSHGTAAKSLRSSCNGRRQAALVCGERAAD